MAFDIEKFDKGKFTARTKDIPAPGFEAFFGEGEKPVFKIRGLTAIEIAIANEAERTYKNKIDVFNIALGPDSTEKTEAIMSLFGFGKEVPSSVVRMQEIIVQGSIDPPMTNERAVKLCDVASVFCHKLSNEILLLSDQVQEMGKPSACLQTKK